MTVTKIDAFACFGAKEPVKPFEYTPRPLGPRDITVKITNSGICGSDLHHMDEGWKKEDWPIVPGHEIIGTVAEMGDQVKGFELGQMVGVGVQVWTCFGDNCRACTTNSDNLCPQRVATYSSNYADGSKTYGGYASHVRVQCTHVVPIPKGLSPAHAAPLLCAGVTTLTPLRRLNVKAGMTVGVVGIGGLGHLAIQFAAAMGARVTAVSNSASKKDEALALGASGFVNLAEGAGAGDEKFDVLVMTSSHFSNIDPYLAMLEINGTAVILGLPENRVDFAPFSIIANQCSIMGSLIGSVADMKETLRFAAEHGIKPLIEEFDMKTQINDAIQSVRDGKVRYRAVLKV
ncbi:hypothetical protein HDU86_005034 [Geranomyces michiganensis]|nr:hypothetical protein HDU86_005034 [Geranomyces michiganensis]